jgi:hypothetical protein
MSGIDEHYANEAKRLLADDTFAEAMTRVRTAALNALADADVDDKTAILRLQQKVALTTDVLDELKAMILSMGDTDGGFNPNERPE